MGLGQLLFLVKCKSKKRAAAAPCLQQEVGMTSTEDNRRGKQSCSHVLRLGARSASLAASPSVSRGGVLRRRSSSCKASM